MIKNLDHFGQLCYFLKDREREKQYTQIISIKQIYISFVTTLHSIVKQHGP